MGRYLGLIFMGGGSTLGLMSRGTPACDLSHNVFDVPYNPPPIMDRMIDEQIPVKILSSRNFVCGLRNSQFEQRKFA